MKSNFRCIASMLSLLLTTFSQTVFATESPIPFEKKPLLVEEEEAILRTDIINFAQAHIGIHYRHGGTTPKGFDCSGFTSYVLQYFDVMVSHCSRTQATQGNKISIEDAQPGDLVFFSRGRRGISHVAMVVKSEEGSLYVVHSTCSRGVIVEDILHSDYWRPKIKFIRNVISPSNQ